MSSEIHFKVSSPFFKILRIVVVVVGLAAAAATSVVLSEKMEDSETDARTVGLWHHTKDNIKNDRNANASIKFANSGPAAKGEKGFKGERGAPGLTTTAHCACPLPYAVAATDGSAALKGQKGEPGRMGPQGETEYYNPINRKGTLKN